MKKLLLALPVLAGLALATGCANDRYGSFLAFDTGLPVAISGEKFGSKVGTATLDNILGITFSADRGVKAAAAAGGITKVTAVDEKVKNILGIYVQSTTIVYGE